MSTEAHGIHEENVGAYLLGALTEIEVRGFENHLEDCHLCRDEVERLRPAVDALPRSVHPVIPPPSLKASLMEAVESDLGRSEGRGAVKRTVARLRERLATAGGALGGMSPAAAWVSVSIVLLVGVLAGYGAKRIVDRGSDARTVAARFDTAMVANGSGSLVIPGDAKAGATLRLHGMPSLPPNKTYEVWLQRDGELIPTALFNVGGDGNGLTAVDGDLEDAQAVLVTREPAGGARSPSGKPVLKVSL